MSKIDGGRPQSIAFFVMFNSRAGNIGFLFQFLSVSSVYLRWRCASVRLYGNLPFFARMFGTSTSMMVFLDYAETTLVKFLLASSLTDIAKYINVQVRFTGRENLRQVI